MSTAKTGHGLGVLSGSAVEIDENGVVCRLVKMRGFFKVSKIFK